MNCSVCDAPMEGRGLAVLGFRLCPACEARLLGVSPARPEYDWFAGFVRRGLSEPLLARRDNVVSIQAWRAARAACPGR